MLGDLTRDDVLALVPDVSALAGDPKLDALLNLADDAQALWSGSYVEIIVHVPAEDHLWRDGAEISDNAANYSVRLAVKR